MKTESQHFNDTVYDVVVIGGGPAGMMAAIHAAQSNANVLLLEKNSNLGKKLLITGGGRCNVTNNKPVVREMLSQYKTEGKYLFSTFMQHGVEETIEWFGNKNLPFVEENDGRMFPNTLSAQTVRDVLAQELSHHNVNVCKGDSVIALQKNTEGFLVTCSGGVQLKAAACIVATGGTARPETGSTGEGLQWLRELGHTTVENSFALVPVALKTDWTKNLSGISLEKCRVTVIADTKKQSSATGKVLFTHFGLTGPTILNMSKQIGELLSYGEVVLSLDMFPGVDSAQMNEIFKNTLSTNANKKVRNALADIMPAAVAKQILHICDIDQEIQCNAITKKQRNALIERVKNIELAVSGLLGKDKAVVSAGGVSLSEVDFKTMESKLVPGLYMVGDVLNINRPSGGYSLQLCWSTGAVAGISAAQYAKDKQNSA